MTDSDISDGSDQQESDLLDILSKPFSDITELERDTQLLTKKAKKRLVGAFNGRSENMIEKFVGWLRRKKVTKIQTMLNSLFPKLKHSEEEIKEWVLSVREKKDAAAVFGRVLLADLHHQVSLFQTHMEFLDEVINDVRQLDYDVVREISELKVALHFNQELIKKSRDSTMHQQHHEPVVKSIDPHIIVRDEIFGNIALNQTPKVGGSLRSSPSPSNDLAVATEKKEGEGQTSVYSTESVVINDRHVSSLDDASAIEIEELDSSLNAVVWDGAESKRKSLASRSISINTLPLNEPVTTEGNSRMSRSSSEKLGFSRSFNRKASRGGLISGLFRRQTTTVSSVTDSSTSDRSILSVVLGSKKATADAKESDAHQRVETTPIRKRADSTSSGISSSSEAPTRGNSDSEQTVVVPAPSISAMTTPAGSKKRYNSGRDNVGLKLSSFLQIIPDETPTAETEKGDSDEEELIRRINKCLSLKHILRIILTTIQETQEKEAASLRKMKGLKKELALLVNSAADAPDVERIANSALTMEVRVVSGKSAIPSLINPNVTRGSDNTVGSSDNDQGKHASASSTASLMDAATSHSTEPSSFTKEEALLGGSESDVSYNCSDDSRHWFSEPSNGSDGTASPQHSKLPRFLYDDKKKRAAIPHTSESHDSLSIHSTSSLIENSTFHEAASEFIDDLKALVMEEQIANEKLMKMQAMIASAAQVDTKLKGAKLV